MLVNIFLSIEKMIKSLSILAGDQGSPNPSLEEDAFNS
jgi:hypothetical protein